MAIAFGLVLAAMMASLYLVRLSRGHAEAISRLDELEGRTQPVDIEAFRNLVDPLETQYLQTRLPAKIFRKIERERALAAVEYVQRIAHNAAVLVRLAQAARTNPDPEVARAAQAMFRNAVTVRMMSMRALVKLYVQAWLPQLGLSTHDIFEGYRSLRDSAALLVRLQQPAYASRVNSML